MPHILKPQRDILRLTLDEVPITSQASVGEIVYMFTRLAMRFLTVRGKRFETLCVIMGAFVCAAFEFYRQVAAPYEDEKAKINGNAYEE